ncbi:type 2 lanthipeptide synthetase LanM family protein [Priestia megaterium]|uniref:type 2 lanthipeptide synthetase LanM family protein n=1 Tax=Priestia megaterium TaxID=1404 RepID=UPI002E20DC86|nr:type 2 lanthipeptide synthetase LanM family protein [Priestia megaterium]
MLDLEVRDILSRSAYLNERTSKKKSSSYPDVKEDLNKWQDIVSASMFQKRLNQENIRIDELETILNEKDSPSLKRQLSWLTTLEYILSIYKKRPIDYSSFQVLIDPFIFYMENELTKKINYIPDYKLNKKTVIQSISQELYKKLYSLILKTVVLEINIAKKIGALKGETGKERFRYFMQQFNEKESIINNFFKHYPVLARLLVESTESCINVTFELIERFSQDINLIEQTFEGNFEKLTKIKIGLGDTHQEGRAVSLLEFDSKDVIVYKPRSLDIDECFESIVSWINEKEILYSLKSAKILNRSNYGWQQYISYENCLEIEEVERFYYRLGVYTALFYILGSSDFHAENIIAHNEYPVPIDLETLFSKNLEMTNNLNIKSQLAIELNSSVYSSLMLPIPILEHSIVDFDLSALGAENNQESKKIMSLKLENDGTDDIRIIHDYAKSGSYENRPIFRGERTSPVNFSNELEKGFHDMYMVFLKHREDFLGGNGPMNSFKDVKTRQVLRPTHVYSKFLNNSLHPDYLQNGIDRIKLFDYLWQVSHQTLKFEQLTPLETKDLLRHDIPYFYFKLNSKDIYDSDGNCLKSFFKETGLDSIKRKIHSLNMDDYNKQAEYLRWSLASLLGDIWEFPTKILSHNQQVNPSPSLFLEEAIQLGNELEKRVIMEENKEANWLGLNLNIQQSVDVSVKGPDLYDGILGNALFLAYLAQETNNPRYKELSFGALNTVVKKAGEKPFTHSISVFSGEGAYIYGFVHLGLLLKDNSLIERATERLPYLYKIIDINENMDFVGGLSGFIIACLNIYQELGNDKYLNIASYAGKRLILQVRESDLENMNTGLAHGAAGIAWALSKLGNILNHQYYLDQAERLINYENSKYDSNFENWIDQRKPQKKPGLYWCHGAPGIALSRLMMNEFNYPTSEIPDDLAKSLKQISVNGVVESHCLCHGTLGNVDILLTASQTIHEDSLLNKGLEMGYLAIAQKREHGWVYGLDPRAEMDGFMLGRTGIGYSLLRLYNLEIPSILALELPGGSNNEKEK